MINVFKVEPKGAWQSEAGESYTVKAIDADNISEYPKKSGWRRSLEEAIAAKPAKSTAE